MALSSTHPSYAARRPDWQLTCDSRGGERQIKGRTTTYLSSTSGMREQGFPTSNTEGWKQYQSYIARAVYPDVFNDAVEALLGIMHRKPPTIELPPEMEYLRERATRRGESLEMLMQRVNEHQLVSGRLGLLADLPPNDADAQLRLPPEERQLTEQFYISIYEALSVINWDEGRRDGIELENLNMVVLNETAPERQANFEWEETEKYRVLLLAENDSEEAATEAVVGAEPIENLPRGAGVYQMGVFREENDFNPSEMTTPEWRGDTSSEIPFVFINTKDVVPEPDDPPLLGLANLALAIYRGEADYRQSLFMQGQDTLVVIGVTQGESYRVGAHGAIELSTGGDAKFIGVDSSGLPEQREALVNDYNRAAGKGAQLLDSTTGGNQQSGEALRIRMASRTATISQIVITGAFGVQSLLRKIARWIGADPEAVVITPNTDFIDDQMDGQSLSQWMSAKMLGAPISMETIHEQMQKQGATALDFEEELERIRGEADNELLMNPATQNEEGPEDDEDDEEETEEETEQLNDRDSGR